MKTTISALLAVAFLTGTYLFFNDRDGKIEWLRSLRGGGCANDVASNKNVTCGSNDEYNYCEVYGECTFCGPEDEFTTPFSFNDGGNYYPPPDYIWDNEEFVCDSTAWWAPCMLANGVWVCTDQWTNTGDFCDSYQEQVQCP